MTCMADDQPSSLGQPLAKAFERRILQASEVVFAITDDVGKHFQKKYSVPTQTFEHPVNWLEVGNQTNLFHPSILLVLPGYKNSCK